MAVAIWLALVIALGALLFFVWSAILWVIPLTPTFVLACGLLLSAACAVHHARVRRSPAFIATVARELPWGTSGQTVWAVVGLTAAPVVFNVLVVVLLGPVPWLLWPTFAQVVALGFVIGSLARYQRIGALHSGVPPGATAPALSLVALILSGVTEYGIKTLDWVDRNAHHVTQLTLSSDGSRGWALGRTSATLESGVWRPSDVRFSRPLVDSLWYSDDVALALDEDGVLWSLTEGGKRPMTTAVSFPIRALSRLDDGGLILVGGGEGEGRAAQITIEGAVVAEGVRNGELSHVSCVESRCWVAGKWGVYSLLRTGDRLSFELTTEELDEVVMAMAASRESVFALGERQWLRWTAEGSTLEFSPSRSKGGGWWRGSYPTAEPERPKQACVSSDGTSGWAITKHYSFQLHDGAWREHDWSGAYAYSALVCDSNGGAWVARAMQPPTELTHYPAGH